MKREEKRLAIVQTSNAISPLVWNDIVRFFPIWHINHDFAMHSSFIILDLNSYPSYFAAYHESWHVGGMFITNSPFLCMYIKKRTEEQQWIYWILVNYTDEPFVFSPTNFFFLLQHAYYLDYKVLLHDSFFTLKILFLNLASNLILSSFWVFCPFFLVEWQRQVRQYIHEPPRILECSYGTVGSSTGFCKSRGTQYSCCLIFLFHL